MTTAYTIGAIFYLILFIIACIITAISVRFMIEVPKQLKRIADKMNPDVNPYQTEHYQKVLEKANKRETEKRENQATAEAKEKEEDKNDNFWFREF